MFYAIDPHNGIAIYDQIARQIKFAVASSVIRPGDLVPSVRELAVKLAVNPNTVARSYRDLQQDQVLEPLRGEGLRVARSATERCRKERARLLQERLRAVFQECHRSGLATDELRELVHSCLEEVMSSAKPASAKSGERS
jgi:GntR family transcriptional regulator